MNGDSRLGRAGRGPARLLRRVLRNWHMRSWLMHALIVSGLIAPAIPLASAASLPDLWQDPLHTRPPVLDSGSLLPGDSSLADCAASIDQAQPLALGDAVDLALCHNPQIQAAWAAIKVQAAALGEARAAYLPTFAGTWSRLHTATRYPDVLDADTNALGHTASASFSWRIFDFGGRSANRNAANMTLAAALAQHDATLQKTLSATVEAYFDALTADATQQARLQAVQLAQSTLDATQRREHHGAAGRNDTLQAGTTLAKARLAQQRAQGDREKALALLRYAMGVPAQTVLSLPSQTPASTGDAVLELDHWLEAAQTQHPAIASARLQWQAAQEKVRSARSDGLPTLDFVSNYYQNGYPNQGLQATRSNTTTVGVTLSIPFFEGFARTYKIRGAQAQAEQSEAQLHDVEHQILGEVVKAHADAQSSLANLAASEALLTAAQDALSSSQHRYDRGAADILELLSVQNALTDARQERIRCLSEWQSARLRLLAASGVLGRVDLQAQP